MKRQTTPTRSVLAALAGLTLAGAAAVVVANAVATSSARVAASTSSEGLLETGTVVLSRPTGGVQLLLDADGMYPGVDVFGCLVVEYTGSVPATIKLHGAERQGGLDAFIDFELSRLDDGRCPASPDAPPPSGNNVFDDRLSTFWAEHSSFGDGLELGFGLVDGDRVALGIVATVADDNAAQGLTSDFVLTIEARPT